MAVGEIKTCAGMFLAFCLTSRNVDVSCVHPIVAAVAVGVVDADVRASGGAAFKAVVSGIGFSALDIAAGGDPTWAEGAFI